MSGHYDHIKLIACASIIDELLPGGMQFQGLDFGLFLNPKNLTHKLQEAIGLFAASTNITPGVR